MTTKVSFACMDGEHWACPNHLGVVGFHCECHCHHIEPLSDTVTVHAENKPQQGLDQLKHMTWVELVLGFLELIFILVMLVLIYLVYTRW